MIGSYVMSLYYLLDYRGSKQWLSDRVPGDISSLSRSIWNYSIDFTSKVSVK